MTGVCAPQILASFSHSPPYEAGPQPPHLVSAPQRALLCPTDLSSGEIILRRCDMALNAQFRKR